MVFTLKADKAALDLIFAGLDELPAKRSRRLMNQLESEVQRQAEESAKPAKQDNGEDPDKGTGKSVKKTTLVKDAELANTDEKTTEEQESK